MMETIYLGSDHAGFSLKEMLKEYFENAKIPFVDVGSFDPHGTDDYPDYAALVAHAVSKNRNIRGILICGTGTGMVIAANKIKGIRAALCYDIYSAKMAREHNNTNILTLRARRFSQQKALHIVKVWLKTSFSNEPRHKRRIEKIKKLENTR